MRILFFGSGEFGLPSLQALYATHDVAAVISQPDRPAGRHRRLTPTPVAAWAVERGLPVLRVADVNTPEFVARVAAYEARASVVIAFGQKLSPPLIDAMGQLAINLHASLLPRLRGAAPINRAILDGHTTTGVCVIGLAQRMDAGPMYAAVPLAIDPDETAGELHDRLARLGPEAVATVLDDLGRGALNPVVQDEALATKAPKLCKADGTVSFDATTDQVRARVHGLTPWPGCRVVWARADGTDAGILLLRRVRVADAPSPSKPPGTVLDAGRVACEDGAVQLVEVQAPGGNPMPIDAFIRGHALGPDDHLGPVV